MHGVIAVSVGVVVVALVCLVGVVAVAGVRILRARAARPSRGRLVEPDLARPPRDRRTPARLLQRWRRPAVDPRSNGHAKHNGNGTLR